MVILFALILFAIFFQIIVINTLEINLYIVTQDTSSQELLDNIKYMDTIRDANEQKPTFNVTLSSV